MPLLPPPPPLTALDEQPSWTNRARRVDRSACFEIRASELWRDCGNMTRDRTTSAREAAGTVVIDALRLHALHEQRPPFELDGDARTRKSNALKFPRMTSPRRPAFEPMNPNKGAMREKILGLWGGGEVGFDDGPWRQTIHIERWRRGSAAHDSRPPRHQHFLVCPQCAAKKTKLFMVLCTEREAADAEFAEAWIRLCDARLREARMTRPPEYLTQRATFIRRYGLLFRERRLRCRSCLGVRYGQVRREQRERRAEDERHRAIDRLRARGPEHRNRPG